MSNSVDNCFSYIIVHVSFLSIFTYPTVGCRRVGIEPRTFPLGVKDPSYCTILAYSRVACDSPGKPSSSAKTVQLRWDVSGSHHCWMGSDRVRVLNTSGTSLLWYQGQQRASAVNMRGGGGQVIKENRFPMDDQCLIQRP